MQEENTAKSEEIEEPIHISKQVIMPTHDDLVKSKKYGIPLLRFSPYAIFVKKISSKNKNKVMSHSEIKVNQDTISDFARDFKYEFLVDFQIKEGMQLTPSDMQFIEKVQQIPELKHICMLENSPQQTATDLDKQIKDWKKRNTEKELIVVSEVYTKDMADKIAIAKRNGIKKYAIKFRSFKRYRILFSKFLATLRTLEMYSIVFGIMPTKWKTTKTTMLLPAIHFKANAIARWIAWGGRKVPLTLLCKDWKYREVNRASKGLTDYSGKNRIQIATTNTQFNTALGKIDTINQVSLMIQTLKPLTKVQFESLFN